MLSLQETAATRVARLLASNRLPVAAGFRVLAQPSNDIFAALQRLDLLDSETLDRLFSGHFMLSAGVDLTERECGEQTLWKIAQHGIVSLSLNGATTPSGSQTRLLLPRFFTPSHHPEELSCVCTATRDSCDSSVIYLDIGGYLPCDPFNLLPMINRFSSLVSLIVSGATSLSNDNLSTIASHHFSLRFLDISNCANISDVSGLRALRQLEVLLMHGHHLKMEAAEIRRTFRAWSELREIDLSCTADGPGVDPGVALLEELEANGGRPFWPHLRSIDLAGLFGRLPNTTRLLHRVQLLIDSHDDLSSLSLLATPLSRRPLTASDGRQLKVASAATATHAKTALALYSKAQRAPLAVRALKVLLKHGFVSSLSDEDCLECASLVERMMHFHSSIEAIQEHGIRCLLFIAAHLYYGDDEVEEAAAFLPELLERCMEAAEAFPHNENISERTLRLTDIVHYDLDDLDYVPIVRIGMNLMVKRGGFIGNGFVNIYTYLNKVRRSGRLDAIAADDRIVPVLLNWIRRRNDVNTDEDMNLLYRLAEGRPAVCSQIVESDGVDLAFRLALNSADCFRCGSLSVLAVLANKESSVHFHLCRHDYIQHLFGLLMRSPKEFRGRRKIAQQYLAGCIISHLVNSSYWKDCGIEKEWAAQQLICAVQSWQQHNCKLSSFSKMLSEVFFSELCLHDLEACAGVHLFALWSTRAGLGNVLFKRRFIEEGGCERLKLLLDQSTTLTESAKKLAMEILEAVDTPPVNP